MPCAAAAADIRRPLGRARACFRARVGASLLLLHLCMCTYVIKHLHHITDIHIHIIYLAPPPPPTPRGHGVKRGPEFVRASEPRLSTLYNCMCTCATMRAPNTPTHIYKHMSVMKNGNRPATSRLRPADGKVPTSAQHTYSRQGRGLLATYLLTTMLRSAAGVKNRGPSSESIRMAFLKWAT